MEKPDVKTFEIFDDLTSETFSDIYHATQDLPDGATVELMINSYGGLILDTISIIETLKRFHTKANIIGFACSAAAILAISCDECVMSKNASMLVHSAWSEVSDADDPGIKRCNELQLSIIKNRCPEFDPKDIQKDTWLSAEECLKLNLVDNIYNNGALDYLATCKRYAAKLSNIYNIINPASVLNKENNMEDVKVNEIVEDVKEEVAEQNMPVDDHDLIDVIEKLTEEVNALKARVVALEEVKEEKVEEAEKVEAEATCGDDVTKERINNIYRNIMMPQACVSIGAPKAATQKRVNKVDYKAFKNFIND